jgi:hypothetical protein
MIIEDTKSLIIHREAKNDGSRDHYKGCGAWPAHRWIKEKGEGEECAQ